MAAIAKVGGREAYKAEVLALKSMAQKLASEGKTTEQIARAVSAARREVGAEFKSRTAPALREEIRQRNIDEYGDELGPTIEWLRAKGKSWEEIIESAVRTGGKDLGL
jgi:hypothetical protein